MKASKVAAAAAVAAVAVQLSVLCCQLGSTRAADAATSPASNQVAHGAAPRTLTSDPTCNTHSGGEKICVYASEVGNITFSFESFKYDATYSNTASLFARGVKTHAVLDKLVSWQGSSHSNILKLTFPLSDDEYTGNVNVNTGYAGEWQFAFDLEVSSSQGYWLSGTDGKVFGIGNAASHGYQITDASVDPVVGIASTDDGDGYWVVTRNGSVAALGDANYFGDLPYLKVNVDDIVAIAPTADNEGYWLVGADGGEFAFGDAGFHGSIPGLHIHVDDIVGMVATPNGQGYLLVGSDGGVFVFGGQFHGSLPGLVDNIVAILPTGAETGYVLVGSDGGSFVFGTGSGFYGSLPGRHIHVSDIVGIALTPDQHGYWMAGGNSATYNFGDARYLGTPAGSASAQPITGIAGT